MRLWELFKAHDGRLIDKWAHYFPLYERHFSGYVGNPIRVLEIGIGHGGSLQLWKKYFGERAQIVGLDIDPRCKDYEEDRITVHIGNQASPPLMGRFDIIIDDGSHVVSDQEASIKALWPALNDGGVYWVEDCHQRFPEPPELEFSCCYYPWVCVFEKADVHFARVVEGKPSRPLNAAELQAYGPL